MVPVDSNGGLLNGKVGLDNTYPYPSFALIDPFDQWKTINDGHSFDQDYFPNDSNLTVRGRSGDQPFWGLSEALSVTLQSRDFQAHTWAMFTPQPIDPSQIVLPVPMYDYWWRWKATCIRNLSDFWEFYGSVLDGQIVNPAPTYTGIATTEFPHWVYKGLNGSPAWTNGN